MKGTAIRTLGTTVAERLTGGQPGRMRAMAAAAFAGAAAAAATYKLLRSGGGDNDDED
ncbi:MAG TPA: hypothetical protein VJ741_11130 [Solirubrobacteraceae bacterium]|nr:hypothetical protein [Solirubrobacteraceae bacterium]